MREYLLKSIKKTSSRQYDDSYLQYGLLGQEMLLFRYHYALCVALS